MKSLNYIFFRRVFIAILFCLATNTIVHAATVADRSVLKPGLWWSESQPGSGLDLHRAGNQIFAIWYTHKANGDPIWYTAQGVATETSGTMRADLLKHQWQGGAHAGFVRVGELRLNYTNSEAMTATFSLDGSASITLPMTPFVTATESYEINYSGAFMEGSRPGYGLSVADQGQNRIAVLYAYDQAGEPIWLFGNASTATGNFNLSRFRKSCAINQWCPNLPGELSHELSLTFSQETQAQATLTNRASTPMLNSAFNGQSRNMHMLTMPSSQREADRQLVGFDIEMRLHHYLKAGMRSAVQGYSIIDFSPPPASSNFSATNLQEAGVDEADHVKSDGAYIYAIATEYSYNFKPEIRTARVNETATQVSHVSTTAFGDGTPNLRYANAGLYLSTDKLMVLAGTSPTQYMGFSIWGDHAAWRKGKTRVEIFSRSNPESPSRIWQADLDGHLITSRRIGNDVYLVQRHTTDITGYVYPFRGWTLNPTHIAANEALLAQTSLNTFLPKVAVNNGPRRNMMEWPKVFASPEVDRVPQAAFVIITRIPLNNPDQMESIALSGEADAIYVSQQNLYIASTRYAPTAVSSFGILTYPRQTVTDIHRIQLNSGLVPGGSGVVPGFLNQNLDKAVFRFSEHQGKLRVVTSSENWFGAENRNRLSILEPSVTVPGVLKTTGFIPNAQRPQTLGKPREALHATRFVGDRLYAVTFQQIDPLYVVNVANPTDPFIAGEVELPGFSEYLHPLSNDLLLGIGLAPTGTSVWGMGLQFTLFNVANPAAPSVINQLAVGGTSTRSAALYNHHAFSFLAGNTTFGEFAIPVTRYEVSPAGNSSIWHTSGQYRFRVNGTSTATANLTLRDNITTHFAGQVPTNTLSNDSGYLGRSVIYPNSSVYVTGGHFYLKRHDTGTQMGPL